MNRIAYQDLAAVYDWLVPEELLTPEGNAAMFDEQLAEIDSGGVLDCACGTGMLAVGMALRGFEVSASDASPAMVERTRKLAVEHHADVDVRRSTWEELTDQDWGSHFSAVFCVGNSLTHTDDRPTALRAMRTVLADGGLLVVTSRNWEKVRAEASDAEEVVERHGVRLRVARSWHIPANSHDPHYMDIEVGTQRERLTFWPFTQDQLHADLRAAGFEPKTSSYTRDADRYVVTAT